MIFPIDAYACPRCATLVGIVWRHGWSSAGRAAVLFAALLLLWLVMRASPYPETIVNIVTVAMIAALAATVVHAVAAPFTRNRCQACGHRWR